jgi:hypothetical protein
MSKVSTRSRAGVTAAVLCTVALLGACGTPSDGGATSPSAPSKAGSLNSAPEAPVFAPGAPIDPALGVSTAPVTPIVPFSQWSFDGFPVYSYVPDHPVGIVYLFHGTTGSADFATKVETVDVLNELIRRGYGFVSTESTNRSAKQWDVDDTSITHNPDLARMNELREHVIAATPVGPKTPTYGIGMSNGSAFCALWAATFTKAGLPVSAVGLYMAGPRKSLQQIGGLRVPTFMVVAANDTRTDPAHEKADLASISRAGYPTELHEVQQRPVTAARYLRVPGVGQATADAVVRSYQAAGLIDSSGDLIVPISSSGDIDQQKSLANRVRLPANLDRAQKQEVGDETKDMIAEHQFNAEFKVQNAQFFDAHR